ncbi:MAG TPA: calmodulin [Actinomycetota bacterium]
MLDTQAAYFVFDYPPAPETFVIELTDPARIEEARDILSGKQTERTHVTGIIVKKPAPYNPDWSFHIDPASTSFFAVSIEVCDAAIRYVEEHLDEVGGAFLPGSRWCPWGSRLLRETCWP